MKSTIMTGIADGDGIMNRGPLCSYLTEPFPECYCKQLSSANIPKIIRFCAGDFKLCGVYLNHGADNIL